MLSWEFTVGIRSQVHRRFSSREFKLDSRIQLVRALRESVYVGFACVLFLAFRRRKKKSGLGRDSRDDTTVKKTTSMKGPQGGVELSNPQFALSTLTFFAHYALKKPIFQAARTAKRKGVQNGPRVQVHFFSPLCSCVMCSCWCVLWLRFLLKSLLRPAATTLIRAGNGKVDFSRRAKPIAKPRSLRPRAMV